MELTLAFMGLAGIGIFFALCGWVGLMAGNKARSTMRRQAIRQGMRDGIEKQRMIDEELARLERRGKL